MVLITCVMKNLCRQKHIFVVVNETKYYVFILWPATIQNKIL